MIGHEGPNSLLSLLIKESLATFLSSSSSSRLNYAIEVFSTSISLTKKGEQEYLRVIELVYMFINQVKKEGIKDYIYKEFQQKSIIDFDNVTKSDALSYANSLARRMNFMDDDQDVEDLLWNPYNFKEMDRDDLNKRIDLLVPSNMWVVF